MQFLSEISMWLGGGHRLTSPTLREEVLLNRGSRMTARLEPEAQEVKPFATQLRAAYRELYGTTERNSDAHAKK